MAALTLNKWGHSYGIRIPKVFLKQFHLTEGDHFEMEADPVSKRLILNLVPRRQGWLEAFNAADAVLTEQENKDLSMDFSNQFDEEEWTW